MAAWVLSAKRLDIADGTSGGCRLEEKEFTIAINVRHSMVVPSEATGLLYA
jgi:hypothetical protein